MERYHAFPGTGDGDDVKALDIKMANVHMYAGFERSDPYALTVMRKDTTGQTGTWVKFEDALKRSRKEYDEGFKAAKMQAMIDQYDEGHEAGLKQGRKEGQIKVTTLEQMDDWERAGIHDEAHAAGYKEGHTDAFSSKLAELIDSHKAESTYDGDLAVAEGAVQEIIALLREYQDVKVTGQRGIELATKLTAFVNKHSV